MNKEVLAALWESAKDPLRLLVLAILPILVTYVAALPYQWAIVAVMVLRWIDSFLHEYNKELPKKEQNPGILGVKGLTGF